LKMTTQAAFQKLVDLGLTVKNGETWDLTSAGKAMGGVYKESPQYGRYILWPITIFNELENDNNQKWGDQSITVTVIGKHFETAASRINAIFSELGWIKRDNLNGWLITPIGIKMGGEQSRVPKSGIPYVRWSQSIVNNKILIKATQEAKGETTAPAQEEGVSGISDSVGFREKFRPDKRTADGHWVRSRAEIIIDNFLYQFKVPHAYEKKVNIDEEMYCDFYIPTGKVYIEYWGSEDEEYTIKREKKVELYKRNGLKLIQLEDKDISNLDDILPGKLREFDVEIE
jgi:hypothetical protein